jgi:hypothetical protein
MARFSDSVTVRAQPAEAFDFITDQAHVADWNDHVQRAEVVGGGPVEVGAHLRQHRKRNNREFALDFEVIEHAPPSRHVVAGSVFGVGTTIAFMIDPAEAGSRVTMDANLPGRGLGVLMAPIVAREMRKSTVAALAQLQHILDGPGRRRGG